MGYPEDTGLRVVRLDMLQEIVPGGRPAVAEGQDAGIGLFGTGDDGPCRIRDVEVGVNVFPQARQDQTVPMVLTAGI